MKKYLIILLLLFTIPCFGADSKLTELTEDTEVLTTDLGYTVQDPGGTPASRKATWANIFGTNLTALRGLTFVDASIIQLTGAGAASVLTSGGGNYFVKSDETNSYIEFATPANALTAIGGQPVDSDLTTIASLTPVQNKLMIGNATPAWSVSDYTLAAPGAAGAILYSDGTNWTRATSLNISTLNLPSSNADPGTTAGQIRHDSTVTNHANGAVRWYDGSNIRQMVDMVAATIEGCTDTQVVAYNATSDLFYCKDDANSGSATALDDVADPDADTTISVAGYETTITSTLDEANHSVLTIINTDADRANDTALLTLSDNDTGDANAFYLKMVSDADGTPSTFLSVTGLTFLSTLAFDFGSATLEIPNSDDPDLTITGQLSFDTDGWLRTTSDNGTTQKAIPVQEEIHVTVYKPQDLDDAQRDHFWIWSNESGMSFIVTGWKGWSTSDDTTLTIYEEDADGANDATVDAVELATGSGPYTGSDTSITGPTIENGHLLYIDFDDTDAPAMVKITITGYYNADVN